MHHDQPVRLRHGGDDRLEVEREQRPRVDDLDAHALALERAGGAHGERHRAADRHDGDVAALAHHARLPERDLVRLLGDRRLARKEECLRLEEDHGIVVADRRGEQALGVVRAGRHHDDEAGRVAEPRLQALGVLRAEPDARPGGAANDEWDARRATHHEAQLRGLVRDLVHRHGAEVEELELDDGAQACQRGADARADEARLGDRGVAHTRGAERLVETLRCAEQAANGPDVLAHHDHRAVALQLLVERLVDRLHVRQLARARLRLGPGRRPVRDVHRCEHVRLERGLVGECLRRRRLELGVDLGRHLVEGLATDAVLVERLLEERDRVARLPVADELLVARVGQVGAHRVERTPVRLGLDEAGALAAPRGLDEPPGRLRDGEHVVAVDDLPGDPVPGCAWSDVLDGAARPPAGRERELVVLADEHHRQPPGGGEVQRLVGRPLVGCAVAEEDDRDAVGAKHLRGERGAAADWHRRADDAVAAEDVQLEVGDVHRAAEAPAVAGAAPEQLRHHRVQVAALGDHVAVAAVVADDVVVPLQDAGDADGDRLLPHAAVRCAEDRALLEKVGRALLEAADAEHLAVEVDKRCDGGGLAARSLPPGHCAHDAVTPGSGARPGSTVMIV